jgi:ribosome-associated heat shock protein Hsp15
MNASATLRIDKLLWFLRLTKTRGLAQQIVAAGHLRRNRARVSRSHELVAVGDVLVVPLGTRVRVIEIVALPKRRGPAGEAQACYRALDDASLDDGAAFALAAAPPSAARREPQP